MIEEIVGDHTRLFEKDKHTHDTLPEQQKHVVSLDKLLPPNFHEEMPFLCLTHTQANGDDNHREKKTNISYFGYKYEGFTIIKTKNLSITFSHQASFQTINYSIYTNFNPVNSTKSNNRYS